MTNRNIAVMRTGFLRKPVVDLPIAENQRSASPLLGGAGVGKLNPDIIGINCANTTSGLDIAPAGLANPAHDKLGRG